MVTINITCCKMNFSFNNLPVGSFTALKLTSPSPPELLPAIDTV